MKRTTVVKESVDLLKLLPKRAADADLDFLREAAPEILTFTAFPVSHWRQAWDGKTSCGPPILMMQAS